MGTVMINCPKTGKAVYTGMHIDRATFGSMPVFFQPHVLPIVPHLARVVCRKRMGLRFQLREL